MGLRTSARLRNSSFCTNEQGFTLIELLVVLVIVGILLTIGIASFLGFKDSAADTAAKANVRSALPAIEAYFGLNNGTAEDADLDATTSGYKGMTIAQLQALDASISPSRLTIGTVSATSFCISSTVHESVWRKDGPAAAITAGTCP
jgi:prepilin-type N-terminal cleavage/methylation domain-containing protein